MIIHTAIVLSTITVLSLYVLYVVLSSEYMYSSRAHTPNTTHIALHTLHTIKPELSHTSPHSPETHQYLITDNVIEKFNKACNSVKHHTHMDEQLLKLVEPHTSNILYTPTQLHLLYIHAGTSAVCFMLCYSTHQQPKCRLI